MAQYIPKGSNGIYASSVVGSSRESVFQPPDIFKTRSWLTISNALEAFIPPKTTPSMSTGMYLGPRMNCPSPPPVPAGIIPTEARRFLRGTSMAQSSRSSGPTAKEHSFNNDMMAIHMNMIIVIIVIMISMEIICR
jgi:hypothetical protein